MAKNTLDITIDIEPISKIVCLNTDCKFNLAQSRGPYCNLKKVTIDNNSRCTDLEVRKKDFLEAFCDFMAESEGLATKDMIAELNETGIDLAELKTKIEKIRQKHNPH